MVPCRWSEAARKSRRALPDGVGTVGDDIGPWGTEVVGERDQGGRGELRHGALDQSRGRPLVARHDQQSGGAGAKRTRVQVEGTDERQRRQTRRMGRRKACDVSGDGGREVGLRNTQMLEELEEAFLNGQLRFCTHILPFYLSWSSENTKSLAGATTVPARHSTDAPLAPNAQGSAAGAELPLTCDWTTAQETTAVPPSACNPLLGMKWH